MHGSGAIYVFEAQGSLFVFLSSFPFSYFMGTELLLAVNKIHIYDIYVQA